MRMLHTSDWHIGNRLMERSREEEFRAFFAWLAGVLAERQVDALLISGDVFDTTTPGDAARTLYCEFLGMAYAAGCRQVVITAGNHDGVSNLNAEEPVLRLIGSRVVARLRTEEAAQCLVPLRDKDGQEAVLVCAVPYLRPQDVSLAVRMEDEEGRARAYVDGIAACYAQVAEAAEAWKREHPGRPVIAMGHLALGGAEVTTSTRRLIGTLDAVPESIFPPVFDYVALGHIHRPQSMQGGRIRYCGSPLPMGLDETQHPGKLLLIDTDGDSLSIEELEVPRFMLFERATCATQAEVETLLVQLGERSAAAGGTPVSLQLSYTGTDSTLRSLNELVAERGPAHHVIHQLISRDTPDTRNLRSAPDGDALPTLQELGERHLFLQRLEEWSAASELPPERRARLEALFDQASAEAHASLQPNL